MVAGVLEIDELIEGGGVADLGQFGGTEVVTVDVGYSGFSSDFL